MIKYIAIFMLIVVINSSAVFAQNPKTDTLSIESGLFGMSYKKGGQDISSKEFKQLLKSSSDQSTYELYSSGEGQSTIANILGFGGGFCVGYGLAAKPTNSTLAIVGGAVAVVAIILDSSAKSKMEEAVSKYNSSVSSPIGFFPSYNQVQQETLLVISVHF